MTDTPPAICAMRLTEDTARVKWRAEKSRKLVGKGAEVYAKA